MITLVLGGARSGKSVVAERLVLAHPGPLAYLATATVLDPDLDTRVEWHRRRRDPRFATIEVGTALDAALDRLDPVPALVDALGTWVAGQPEFDGAEPRPGPAPGADVGEWDERIGRLCAALARRQAPTVVVSDEVGMGVHPETAVGRRFRDVLGLVNQRVADVADEVLLVVAGRALHLDRLGRLPGPDPGAGDR